MMVALLLYAYARLTRSSRQISGAVKDVALWVLAGQQRPDHATIAKSVAPAAAAPTELIPSESFIGNGARTDLSTASGKAAAARLSEDGSMDMWARVQAKAEHISVEILLA